MTIIYCVLFYVSYRAGMFMLSGLWKIHENMPERKRSTTVLIGKSEHGKVFHCFTKYPHMIVAGATGYGKTNFLNTLIPQLPGETILIDLKGVDDYEHATAHDIHEARVELERVVCLMRQYRGYPLFVVIDEAGELIPSVYLTKAEKEDYYRCLKCINDIGRLGRSLHVHLVYATQYPTSDILDRQIKQNAESRLCFRLSTEIASRVALDEQGAESLPAGVKGLGIYKQATRKHIQTYAYMKRGDDFAHVRTKTSETDEDIITFE